MINSVNSLINNFLFSTSNTPEKKGAGLATLAEGAAPPVISPPLSAREIQKAETIYARLHNTHLSLIDKSLLRIYMQCRRIKGEGRMLDIVKNRIRSRMIYLGTAELKRYTGREDLDRNEEAFSAIEYAVKALNIFSKKEYLEIVTEIIKGSLSPSDQDLIDKYRKNPSSEKALDDILWRINEYNYLWSGSIWGTNSRADLYRNLSAFNLSAQAAGVEEQDIINASFLDRNVLPDNYIERSVMLRAFLAIDTPEESDNAELKPRILKYYERTVKSFFSHLSQRDPDIAEITVLAKRYIGYEDIAVRLGISHDELKKIEDRIKASFRVRTGNSPHRTRVVTPDQLPQKTVELLKTLKVKGEETYFQFIKNNIDYIVISSDPMVDDEVEAMIGGPAGGMHFADGVIYVRTAELDSETLSYEYYLFSVILHEAFHAYMDKKYSSTNRDNLRSIINEGGAYEFEARALKKLQAAGIPAEIVARLNDRILQDKYSVYGSLRVLRRRNIFNHKNIDIDVYPTNTPFYMAKNYSRYLQQAGFVNHKERELASQVFSNIILDEISFEKIPNNAQAIVKKLLARIDDSWGKMEYKEAFKRFMEVLHAACPGEQLYGKEILEAMLAYVVDYQVESPYSEVINFYNREQKVIGRIPRGSKVRLLMDDSAKNNTSVYVRIRFQGQEGYVYNQFLKSAPV
jgi:hypothetical protein